MIHTLIEKKFFYNANGWKEILRCSTSVLSELSRPVSFEFSLSSLNKLWGEESGNIRCHPSSRIPFLTFVVLNNGVMILIASALEIGLVVTNVAVYAPTPLPT